MALRAQRDRLEAASRVRSLDVARVKREVRDLVGDVAGLLRSNQTPQIRQMLRKVSVGKITCTPLVMDGRRSFRMTGNVTFAPFLKGDVWEAVRSEQPDGGGPNRT